jgi:hypothetical protein
MKAQSAEGMAQVVGYLAKKCKALSSNPSTIKKSANLQAQTWENICQKQKNSQVTGT